MRGQRLVGPSAFFLTLVCFVTQSQAADLFGDVLRPFFAEHCIYCHGDDEVNGNVNLEEIATAEQWLQAPRLIVDVIEAITANDMPPEGEPELSEKHRATLLATLKTTLRETSAGHQVAESQFRRLNRFQYNNAVRDLFQLKRDVFALPEKLMTRHDGYVSPGCSQMPDRVTVASHALNPQAGLREVNAFPKDLRASHGFDNQANQLTLSPLLLDSFLRLSVSILESPDFNENTVGIWNDFFREPAAELDLRMEVRQRLRPFLKLAFRRPIDADTLDRYAAFAISKLDEGVSFTSSMKRVASAVLSSPMFLYRTGSGGGSNDPYALAANLSFLLWASGPDRELLRLAESGELAQRDTLNRTIDRMLSDPKIERFLDTFPAQWMQLENVLAATPDPDKQRLFSLDKDNPASLQMVLEPLLLFDAVFIEDRPIIELIAPSFSYQSNFLNDWYTSDLKPPPLNEAEIAKENRVRKQRRDSLQAGMESIRADLAELEKALADPIANEWATVDLTWGQIAWEAAQAKQLATDAELSSWRRIGPFTADSYEVAFTTTFLDEAAVDLSKQHGELSWEDAAQFVDGAVHRLSGEQSATYLFRTIQSGSARPLNVSLGSDDGLKVWLNGELILDRQVRRGVAPDQEKLLLNLVKGENTLLLKVINDGGDYGFYFRTQTTSLPDPVVTALKTDSCKRTTEQQEVLTKHYLSIAPELADARQRIADKQSALSSTLKSLEERLAEAPEPESQEQHQAAAQRRFDDELRNKLRSRSFTRRPTSDPRYGGVITNAAMLSMTSGPTRTHPIARGAWIIEVILNDPPPPPPNDVPPLAENDGLDELTIRERFAQHREHPDCAGCHVRLDPLGFALENFDITGRWREQYENGRTVDSSGTLLRKHAFDGVIGLKESLVKEEQRFATAFTKHLLRFAIARELYPKEILTVEAIVEKTKSDSFRLRSLIREVILSESFLQRSGVVVQTGEHLD